MRFFYFTLVCSWLIPYLGAGQTKPEKFNHSLTGYIRDATTKQPIQGVTVFITENRRGTTTSRDGFFVISLPAGTYNVKFTHVGFHSQTHAITLNKTVLTEILLQDDSKDLEEVTVTTEAPDRNVKKVELGVTQMTIKTIKRIPAFMGEADVVRSLLLLPGVTTVGEGAPGINVRGGSTDQNLVLMDDAPIFNSSHLMGFFSVFNPDIVRDVTLNRGGIAPSMGGRAASVLDIRVKEPETEKISVNGGIGVVASRLGIEGPILNKKLSFLLAGRASFNDFLFKLLPRNIRDTKANFYDVTTKLKFQPNEKHTVTFTGYNSHDAFKLASDSLSTVEVNASSTLFEYRTLNGTLKWNYAINNQLNLTTTAIYSQYRPETSAPDSANAFRLTSEILHRQLKADLSFDASENHQLQGGFSLIDYYLQPNKLVPGFQSNVLAKTLPIERAYELAVYVQDEWKVNEAVSILGGFRYSQFLNRGPATVPIYQEGAPLQPETTTSSTTYNKGHIYHQDGGIEPRLAVRWTVGEGQSIKAGYNRLRQYIHQITNTTAALPISRWKLSDSFIKPQIADQWSVGYFKNTAGNAIEASAEVYYKTILNAIDYKDGANLTLNPTPETDLLQGSGKAYGLETQLKKNKGRWIGWVSYTYSRALYTINGAYPEERVNNGRQYPANFDKPHTLNAMTTFRPNNRVNMSFNFTFSTGRPVTQPYARARINGIIVPIYINRNQQRIPDYHRLDFAVEFNQDPVRSDPAKKRRYERSWVFSIYNVYARKNAYSVFFKLNSASLTDGYKLSVFGSAFPSLTYNFKF
ncbi:TonB-dependent receptor [Larkinella terrae]|uniref:TonB-dependent receptor plug domain-containing protein n=1 Tax=Larkinella terrae TaxID=2025311 RepID=A0A7K0ETK0_9BACT|nr:TonB-dependent receptor [Larkinella terrae]MRS65143.1 TonB-dependent receptor plug domain-containing protein [Larkinella terrae]